MASEQERAAWSHADPKAAGLRVGEASMSMPERTRRLMKTMRQREKKTPLMRRSGWSLPIIQVVKEMWKLQVRPVMK
jgi:hypothetical protein